MERAPLTGKKDAKAIRRLNAAQRMHKGLNHQDVVGLEQEYEDKMAQFNERETKTPKVDPEPCATSSNNVTNEVPVNPSTNVNEVPRAPSNNTNEVPSNNKQ